MKSSSKQSSLDVLGSTEFVDVVTIRHIPAKIDTGADSSSIWASHIYVTEDGVLHFQLFDQGSPLYTGEEITREDFKVAVIRTASGQEQIRYRTHLTVTIRGRKIKALFNLSDRSRNNFPVLIGRRTISRKFLVDVSMHHTSMPAKSPKSRTIQRHFREDPYNFHRKYIDDLHGDINEIEKTKERSTK